MISYLAGGLGKITTFLFMLFLGSLSIAANAQTTPPVCKDENLANPFYPCGSDFRPVCACDGKTYHNECAAFQNAGIQGNQWTSGICEEFYFTVYPVPAYGTLTVKMQFREQGGSATLVMMNMFGQMAFQQFVNVDNNFPLTYQYDMQRLPPGFYMLTLYSNNHRQTQIIPVINP